MFRFELSFQMRLVAMPMVSWDGILVKRLVTSKETLLINLLIYYYSYYSYYYSYHYLLLL